MERETVRVKWFSGPKGYGFCTRKDGTDVFVHYSDIEMEGFRLLEDGQEVTCEIERGAKGLQAIAVRPVVPADGNQC